MHECYVCGKRFARFHNCATWPKPKGIELNPETETEEL